MGREEGRNHGADFILESSLCWAAPGSSRLGGTESFCRCARPVLLKIHTNCIPVYEYPFRTHLSDMSPHELLLLLPKRFESSRARFVPLEDATRSSNKCAGHI